MIKQCKHRRKARLGSDVPEKQEKVKIVLTSKRGSQRITNQLLVFSPHLNYPVTLSSTSHQRMFIAFSLGSHLSQPRPSSSTSSCFGPGCLSSGHKQASPQIDGDGDLVLPQSCLLLAFPSVLPSSTQLISQRRWIDSLQPLWI